MEQMDDSDDDVHICGSCRAEFSDVQVFVDHKKYKCHVRLAKKQKRAVNNTDQQLLSLNNSNGLMQDETILQSNTDISDISQTPQNNHIAIHLSQDGSSLGYFPLHIPAQAAMSQANIGHTLDPTHYPTEFFNQGNTSSETQEYVILPPSSTELQSFSMKNDVAGFPSQATPETLYTLDSHIPCSSVSQGLDTSQVVTDPASHIYTVAAETDTHELQTHSVHRDITQVNLADQTGDHVLGKNGEVERSAMQLLAEVGERGDHSGDADINLDSQSRVNIGVGHFLNKTSAMPVSGSAADVDDSFVEDNMGMQTRPMFNTLRLITPTQEGAEPEDKALSDDGAGVASVNEFQYTITQNFVDDKTLPKEPVLKEKQPKVPLKKKFHCDQENCKYKTAYLKDMERHSRIHTGEKPYKCNQCSKCFNRSDKLMLHQRYHMNDRPFKCSLCPYRAVENGSLKKHMLVHMDYEDRPHCCQVCSYKSRSRTQLQVHLRTHTGDTPYHCKLCDATFKVNSDLKRHMRVHTGEKPFACNIEGCDYKCSIKSNLQSHDRTHHKVVTLQCNGCDFKTSSKKTLQEHKKSHFVNAGLICEICNYQCSNRSALRNHKKLHLVEKPFECTYCSYRSSQRGNMQTHMRRKHPAQHVSGRPEARRKSKINKVDKSTNKLIGAQLDIDDGVSDGRENGRDNLKAKCPQLHLCNQCPAKFVREDSLACHLKHHKDSSLSTAYAVLKLQQPVINTSRGNEALVSASSQLTGGLGAGINGQSILADDNAIPSPDVQIKSEAEFKQGHTLPQSSPHAVTTIGQSSVAAGHILHQGQMELTSPIQGSVLQGQQVSLGINDILLAAGMSGLNSASTSPTNSKEGTGTSADLRSNPILSNSPLLDSNMVPGSVVGQSPQDVPSVQVMQNISLPYIRLPNGQVLILTGQTSLNSQTGTADTADGSSAPAITAEVQSQLLVQQPEVCQDQIIQCAADSTTPTVEASGSAVTNLPTISGQAPETLATQQGAIPIQIILPSDSQQGMPLVSQLLNSVANRNVDDTGNQNQVTVQTNNQSAGSQTVQNFVLQIPAQAGALKDAAGNVAGSQSYVLQIPGTNFN